MTEKVLEGQVALVTGASRGIGRTIAAELASLGAHVVVNYARSEAEAQSLCAAIAQSGGSADALQFNVGVVAEVENGVKTTLERHGKISILVNNAGVTADNLLVRTKPEDWDRVIAVNLTGAFTCARLAARSMMKERYGRIINISSIIGEMGNAGQTAYAASKAGLIGLTKSLAKELASRGITANAVTPGYIATDMTADLDEALRNEMLKAIPLGRLGEAQDVASLVSFLARPESGYITGQVVGVNGGMYM